MVSRGVLLFCTILQEMILFLFCNENVQKVNHVVFYQKLDFAHPIQSHEKSHEIPLNPIKFSNSQVSKKGQSNLARKNSWTVQRRLKQRQSRESNKNPLGIVSLYHIYLW